MSSLKLVRIDPNFIAELFAATGSEQIIRKENRMFVGLYNEDKNWFFPLRSNLGKKKPLANVFDTPFKTDNPHFKRPGLDFEKALYVPESSVIEIKNTLPKQQYEYIREHRLDIESKFEKYIISVESLKKTSPDYLFSTVPFFPEGIRKIKDLQRTRLAFSMQDEKRDHGLLIVYSGPSGVGKGTVRDTVFNTSQNQFAYSVSITTRPKRLREVDGKDYFFTTRENFEEKIKSGQMLEYSEYVGNYYGTPLDYVNQTLAEGKDIILEVDVAGARQIKEKFPDSVSIFLAPPDVAQLHERLRGRGTETAEVINERIEKASEELAAMGEYDHVVVNDDVALAAEQVAVIVKESKESRMTDVNIGIENEPSWGKIIQNAPKWFDAAYETETGDDHPAKTSPIDFGMLMDDFEMKDMPLDDNSPLTDKQKIELQETYAFYDNNNKFHSFQEVLERVGGSIPKNMPIVQDDRPTEINEEELEKIEGKIMENNKSFDHIKNSAEWRAEEIKIKEGQDVFQEQNIKDFVAAAPKSNLENRMNADRFDFGVGNQYTTDFDNLTYYDTFVAAVSASDFDNDEHVFVLYKKTGDLEKEFDTSVLDEATWLYYGATENEISEILQGGSDINSDRDQARQLLTTASVTPEKFVQCIDENMIATVHYQPGNNRSLSNADFSDGFNNFYRFINDDGLIKNMLELELSSEAIQSLFEMAEIEDLTDYEGLADYLAGDPDEMLGIVKDSYIDATEQFGIVRNQTTSSYQLDAGDAEKYYKTQLKDFEQEMNLKTGTLVDNYSFEVGSFDEVLSLDKAELPHINEEDSIDAAEYVTYTKTGEFVSFNAYQIDFAGNSNVLSRYELEQVAQAAYDVFEELDISFEPEEDLPDIIEEHPSFFSQELEEQGIGTDKIEQLINSDLVKNLDSLVNSNVFEGVLHPTKAKSI